jgi:hypothetical protein
MADDSAVALIQFLSGRQDRYERRLNEVEDWAIELRDTHQKDVAEINQKLAVATQIVEANSQLLNKVITGIITGTVLLVMSAVGVILFGPG